MECHEVEDLFYRKFLGAVSPHELKQLELHKQTCLLCQKEDAFWQEFKVAWQARDKEAAVMARLFKMIRFLFTLHPKVEASRRNRQMLIDLAENLLLSEGLEV